MREEMVKVRSTPEARGSRRWIGFMTLALAAALIPAAIALACNPQAYLTLDKSQYAPGESVRVTGSFFRGDANVTVSLDRTGQSSTVRTSANGSFQTTFALPGGAPSGGYTVNAIGYEANGDVVNGLPARSSFSVGAAQSAPPANPPSGGEATPAASEPGPQAAQPSTGQPSAPAAARPTPRPAAPSTNSSGFREPSVTSEPNVQTSRAARGTTRRSTSGPTRRSTSGPTSAPASSDRASVGGRAVFAGSVAPATVAPSVAAPVTRSTGGTRASTGTRAGSRSGGAVSGQAAEQTATDDVWGALSSGRSPSVLPVAGDGVSVGSPRSGSQLTLGVLLLGGGVLALAGALAVGEARRRRVRVR